MERNESGPFFKAEEIKVTSDQFDLLNPNNLNPKLVYAVNDHKHMQRKTEMFAQPQTSLQGEMKIEIAIFMRETKIVNLEVNKIACKLTHGKLSPTLQN